MDHSGSVRGQQDARPLLEARPEYLRAAFDAIDAAFGSLDAYWTDGLELKASQLEELREQLLTAHGS